MPKMSYSAGGIVINTEGQVLVVNQHNNSWSLPKGHLDAGEDELTAAKREIWEESGVSDLTLIKPLGAYSRFRMGPGGKTVRSAGKHITMFLFSTKQLLLSPQDPDNPEARWVHKDKVEDLLTHPIDKSFFKDCEKKLNRIRPILFSDGPTIEILMKQLGNSLTSAEVFDRIERYTQPPLKQAWTIEYWGEIAGIITLDITDPFHKMDRIGHIYVLVILDKFRRKGLAKQLLDHVDAYAKSQGCRIMELTTASSRHNAHALYKAHGYQDMAQEKKDFKKTL